MTADAVDLFVGQMIGLLPKLHPDDIDDATRRQLRVLFPRVDGEAAPVVGKARRPRTYSVITNGRGGGVLTVGGTEIPVAILPLDVSTPPEATAFRIVAIAGRAMRVRGVAEGDVSR
ncbi:hypothetical protein [Microbacterium lacticum]